MRSRRGTQWHRTRTRQDDNGSKKKRATGVDTSPDVSWADRLKGTAAPALQTSAEITVDGVVIRARLIDQGFQEMVDPKLSMVIMTT